MMTTRQEMKPVLARRAGQYREFAPEPALRNHFRCLWSHHVDGDNSAPIAIVPDGHCDIVFAGGRLFVAGPDLTSAFPMIDPGEEIVGLRFAPGSASLWLRLPMDEMTGRSVPLRDFLGPEIAGVEERLSALPSTGKQLRMLAALLRDRSAALEIADAPKDMRALFESLRCGCELLGVHRRLDIGERQLRRRSRHAFGYGPKTLSRILRFQRSLALLNSTGSLAEIAVAAGYADQAHMTREAVELSTLTPLELRRQISGR